MKAETNRARRGHDFYPPDLADLPKIHDQEGKEMNMIVHLHYFSPATDHFVTEVDPEQGIAFGYSIMYPHEGEFGYMDLPEMEEVNVSKELIIEDENGHQKTAQYSIVIERDLYWEKKTLAEALKERRGG